jgi:pyruvate/2-oxoglutarate dehydrogenase complex dihydrolipoamide acyltransferase (E2) component
MRLTPIAPERRHTLYFLREVRAFAPVFLDTEIDMASVSRHRTAARDDGHRYSVVTYVLYAAAQALAKHPEANAAIQGRRRPKVARYETVNGKLTLDRSMNGHRVVLSAVLPGLDQASLDDVQRQVDHYRDGDPAQMPEFAGTRILHRLPWPLGPAALRFASRPLRKRPDVLGTFAVTSLGHRPVDGFHSVGGTTVTIGVGQITDRPVARDGQVQIAPTMRLSLAFDHRVIDGAEAADLVADIKEGLEGFAANPVAAVATAAPAGHEVTPDE